MRGWKRPADGSRKVSRAEFLASTLNEPVYWPANGDAVSKGGILELCSGNLARAVCLFEACDGTAPADLIEKHGEGFFGMYAADRIRCTRGHGSVSLEIYARGGIPLFKWRGQERDVSRLLGRQLGARVLNTCTSAPGVTIELARDEYYFSPDVSPGEVMSREDEMPDMRPAYV